MSSRRNRRGGEAYEPSSNRPTWSTTLENSGDHQDQRGYSTIDYPTSYESAPSGTSSSYPSYTYPSHATSHAAYHPVYGYATSQYPVPDSQAYTVGDSRSLPTYRSDYRSDYQDSSYSTAEPPSPPSIEVSHVPASMNSAISPWQASYNNGAPYGTSYEQTQNGIGLAPDLQRQPSNESEGSDGKERRFICDQDPECKAAFVRKADLSRHIDCVHLKVPQFSCPVKNCARKGANGFTRRDHRTEHLRHFHHRVIPKRPRGNQNMDEEDDEDDTHYHN